MCVHMYVYVRQLLTEAMREALTSSNMLTETTILRDFNIKTISCLEDKVERTHYFLS